ncbi:restriction endonuclease subunit S, partial [Enterococcus sp. 6D12_DIV0197]|uniref:restriction endonuclease subunit S n=2 Tax=Enterococcus TaxID=1350 RepID=UPI0014839EEB
LTAELTAELTARKKQYTYYRDQLLTFEEGEVEWKALGEIFDFKNGINKGKEFFGSGDNIINYTDVFKNNKLFENSIVGKVQTTSSDIERFSCRRGDVFFTRTSETKDEIGYASVLLTDISICVFSGFLIRARPKTNLLLPEYCAYCFRSHEVRKEIINSSNMTTRVTTTGTILSKIKIPIPSLEEQARIVSILDKFEALTSSITEGLPREIELRQKQYEYYRNMLLSFPKEVV